MKLPLPPKKASRNTLVVISSHAFGLIIADTFIDFVRCGIVRTFYGILRQPRKIQVGVKECRDRYFQIRP